MKWTPRGHVGVTSWWSCVGGVASGFVSSHRLAAYRAKRDYSLHEVAWKLRELSRAVDGIDSGPTVKTVWRWERGSTPTARYRRLRCQLYDATAAELGFQTAQAISTGQRDPVLSPISRCDSPRDELLAAIATIAGLLDHGPRQLGLVDVARLDAVTTLYRSLDYECGGGMLHVEVGRFAEISSGLLDHRCSDDVRSRLLGAIASARQLAGWTAFDAGADCDAQRHWIAAERAAVAASDGRLALLAQHGRVYRDLARADRTQARAAVQCVSDAIDAFTPASGLARNRLLNEIGLCSALFLAGEPEEAIAVAGRLIPSAEQMTSARVIDRIRGVRRDLADCATHPGVSEFADRLDGVAAAA